MRTSVLEPRLVQIQHQAHASSAGNRVEPESHAERELSERS